MSIIIAKFRASNKQTRLVKEHVYAYERGFVIKGYNVSLTFVLKGFEPDGFETYIETHDEAVAERVVQQLDVFFGVVESDAAPIHAQNRAKGFDVVANTEAAKEWVKENPKP